MFQGLPGPFLPGKMILLAVMLGGRTVRVGRLIVQFSGALVIFVMRSVVIASRH